MNLTRGVFLDAHSVDCGDLDLAPLRACLPEWRLDNQVGALRSDQVGNADVLVVNKIQVDGNVLAQCKNLRLICVAATGVNNIDLDGAAAAGITVCNARSYATPSVVEHVFALLLSLRHRIREHTDAVQKNRWSRSSLFCLFEFPFEELVGQTLGIFGYGELGQAVARAGEAFGMEILVAERPGKALRAGRIPFQEWLARSDVISLHCPLTPETEGLIGQPEFERMKSTAVVINTARGGIVDESALLGAIRAERIGGAGLDVLGEEPPGNDHSLATAGYSNLVVTPHVAWASRSSRQRLLGEIIANIEAFQSGVPRNLVNGAG